MHEYNAKLLSIVDAGVLELDIDLGIDNIHIHKRAILNNVTVPSVDDKLEDASKGLAAKQRLYDLIKKAEDGVFRVKTEEIKGELYVTIYIGGMNVNKKLVEEGLASGTGY